MTLLPVRLETTITKSAIAIGRKLKLDWLAVPLTETVSLAVPVPLEPPGPDSSVVPRTIEFWLLEVLNDASEPLDP